MLKVGQITDDYLQKQSLVLPDGSSISLTLYYMELQQGWFIRELVYGDFILRGVRISNNPNFLHQYKNQIPFGMGCFSVDNREPFLINDFLDENSILYILTEDEVVNYTDVLSGQT